MSNLKQLKVVSTFSGVGGSSLGYVMAGFKVVCALEMVKIARENYNLNFPDTPIISKDIRDVKGQDILDLIGLKKGELDCLDGSPPCSSYSIIGNRTEGWGKSHKYSQSYEQRTDNLIEEQIRLIKEIYPKSFVMENVRGLSFGVARPLLSNYCNQLKDLGYDVSVEVLKAENYGCATLRERLFIIGIRSDLKIKASHPVPTTKSVTFKQAVTGLIIPIDELNESRNHLNSMGKVIPAIIKTLKPLQDGSKLNAKKNFFSYKRCSMSRPIYTLTTHIELLHPRDTRFLTISEIKVCSGFPQDFKLKGSYMQRYERIGRAVPPKLMFAVANHVKQLLNNT